MDKRVKQNVRKFYLCCAALITAALLLYTVLCVLIDSNWAAAATVLLVAFLAKPLLNKWYFNYIFVFFKQGEPALTLAAMDAIGMKHPDHSYRLQCMLALDQCQEVVNVCVAGLKKHKGKKGKRARYRRYFYLHMLAAVYHRLGDDQKLTQICQVWEDWIALETPMDAENLKRRFSIFDYCQKYLNRDAKGCLVYARVPAGQESLDARMGELMMLARIKHMIEGDWEGAKDLYARVAEQMPSDHSRHKAACRELENIANGRPYGFGLPDILPDADYKIVMPVSVRVRTAVGISLVTLCGIAMLASMLDWSAFKDNRLGKGEYASVEQCIERNESEIDVLKVFPVQADGKDAGLTFIGTRGSDVVVGSFEYANALHLQYVCCWETPISQKQLMGVYPQFYLIYTKNITDEYVIVGQFFNDPTEIPEGTEPVSFELKGKTYYYVVSAVMDLMWVYEGDELVECAYIGHGEGEVTVGYVYLAGGETTWLKDVTGVTYEQLADPTYVTEEITHAGVNKTYQVVSRFYRDRADIPTDALGIMAFEADGQTYYYAVLRTER